MRVNDFVRGVLMEGTVQISSVFTSLWLWVSSFLVPFVVIMTLIKKRTQTARMQNGPRWAQVWTIDIWTAHQRIIWKFSFKTFNFQRNKSCLALQCTLTEHSQRSRAEIRKFSCLQGLGWPWRSLSSEFYVETRRLASHEISSEPSNMELTSKMHKYYIGDEKLYLPLSTLPYNTWNGRSLRKVLERQCHRITTKEER